MRKIETIATHEERKKEKKKQNSSNESHLIFYND